MTNPPTPPLSDEEAPQTPMSDEWIKSFRQWTNPPVEKEAIAQKPYPPDPDAGYVRHHASIHSDLLKVNIENSRLRSRISLLEANSLTPEEAAAIKNAGCYNKASVNGWAKVNAIAKLRLLSESEEKP